MILEVTLVSATVLCSLMAGFLFAYAVVIMPGIRDLPDREFILAFQVTDGVIQRGQPLFGVVWLGSAVALVVALAVGVGQLAGTERLLLIGATAVHLLGVQLPTIVVNVPLNNQLQSVDVAAAAADGGALRSAREAFEARWNRSNVVRTVLSIICAVALAVLLLRV